MTPYQARVITVSDRAAAGAREDLSGPAAADALRRAGLEVDSTIVVGDDRDDIVAALRSAIEDDVAVVVTTGGTGLAERDVTPEATAEVIDREVPGLAELMRAEGSTHTPMAVLSRAVAGTAGKTLVLNLPGSTAGVEQSLASVLPLVAHALDVLRGAGTHREDTRAN